MAYNSVDSLFQQLNLAEIKKVGKIYNPDIPEFHSNLQNKNAVRDTAYLHLKATSQPRNQDNLILPRTRLENPQYKDMMLDNSINPVYARAKVDPDSLAPPVEGEDILYSTSDPSMTVAHDSISLLQKARESFYNYNNRLNTIDLSKLRVPMVQTTAPNYNIPVSVQNPMVPSTSGFGANPPVMNVPIRA